MEPSECSHSPFCFTAFRHSGHVSSFSNHCAMHASQNTCPHDSLIGRVNSSIHTEQERSRSDCSDTDSPYIYASPPPSTDTREEEKRRWIIFPTRMHSIINIRIYTQSRMQTTP